MKIDLTNLFNGNDEVVSIDYTLNLENLVYSTYQPIKNGALVKGSVFEKAEVVYLKLNVSFVFYGFCDRCAEDLEKNMSFDLNKILVRSLANDVDYDDYIVVENGILDLDELIEEEMQLFLPSKMLCR